MENQGQIKSSEETLVLNVLQSEELKISVCFVMARKCSRCGEKGHNARTCTHDVKPFSFKLFGVKLTSPNKLENSFSPSAFMEFHGPPLVYNRVSNQTVRKKGVPWNEEEQWCFLLGLEKLGRGDWRGISREFVRTRTPTQVASHAQKYFLSKTNFNKKKNKMSIFDMSPKETSSLPTDENITTNSVKEKIGSEFGEERNGEILGVLKLMVQKNSNCDCSV